VDAAGALHLFGRAKNRGILHKSDNYWHAIKHPDNLQKTDMLLMVFLRLFGVFAMMFLHLAPLPLIKTKNPKGNL